MAGTRQQTAADEIRAAYATKAEEVKTRRDLSNEGRDIQLACFVVYQTPAADGGTSPAGRRA